MTSVTEMRSIGLLVIAMIGLVNIVTAEPDGAPKTACETMEPQHTPANTFDMTKNQFTIASACYVFMPGESMYMRAWSTLGQKAYRGIFVQVRRVDPSEQNYKNLLSGKFTSLSSATQTVDCGSSATAITHSDDSLKTDSSVFFLWTAPSSCNPGQEYEIWATVAVDEDSWQTGIRVPMVCNPDYSNEAAMRRVRPPQSYQYCSVQSWAIIPKGLTTSFEMNTGTWTNRGIGAGKEWIRRNQPTPTAGTGPNVAKNDDGSGTPEYFLYYEATGGNTGDKATLAGKSELQGCFCFSFWCHMHTQGKVEFRITAKGDYVKPVLSTKAITNYWRQVRVTFLSVNAVEIVIEAIRGNSNKADIGIDEIKVSPGPCDKTKPFIYVDMTKP